MTRSVLFNLKSIIYNPKSTKSGFTIVELLVVIVVIGILAAITIVSYTGISSKAIVASLTSDLDNASKQMKLYYIDHGNYPVTLNSSNCPTDPADTKYCLKPSSDTTFTYSTLGVATNPQSFALQATKSGTSYIIANNTTPAQISANPTNLNCPSGFIPVPGSITYGTADFCVMKYEAKNAGGGVPESTESGAPWVNISQTTAITNSANVAACTDCHLITEAEWLTIAQNVLSVNSNWSDGTVGNGCIFRGNVGTLDACGYDGADPEFGTGRNAKASLTLTNGEVIWDFAGNVWEWTSGTSTTGQPGITGESAYAWKQWNTVTTAGTLSPSVLPSDTGISGAGDWTSTKGIGQLFSNASETGLRGFRRSGGPSGSGTGGVLTLYLTDDPSYASAFIGFRVSR